MKIKSLGANKTEIDIHDVKILISYETPVSYIDLRFWSGYKTEKFHSVTTSRHINQWLFDNGVDSLKIKSCSQEYLDSLLDTK